MMVKISIAIATFLGLAASFPIDHQEGATSYVSLSLGGHSKEEQQQYIPVPEYHATPVYVQKEIPTVQLKVPVVSHTYKEEEYGPAAYEFKYAVEDKHTGDIKSQHEVNDGKVVSGEYSLHEPDGTIRTVKYTADKHNGFNAIVEKSGHASHPEVVVKAVPLPYDYHKH